MLPRLEGTITRRVLLNFRADPEVVRCLVPEPLEVANQNGFAVVGVCLVRLEQLRPKGLPSFMGVSSEGMAHRVAVRYPTPDGWRDGVFVWRRETDRRPIALVGGRVFPGVHRHAEFLIAEDDGRLAMAVFTERNKADVSLEARYPAEWTRTSLFGTFEEASRFFERGDCGFSCSPRTRELEGIQLRTHRWKVIPLQVHRAYSAFFENPDRFPPGSVECDSALLMHGVVSEWHSLDRVPQMAAVAIGALS